MKIKKRNELSFLEYKFILKDKKSLSEKVYLQYNPDLINRFRLQRGELLMFVDLPMHIIDKNKPFTKKEIFNILAYEMYNYYYLGKNLDNELTIELSQSLKVLFREDFEKFILYYSVYSEIGFLSTEF